jgi:hypothetical protein
MPKHGQSASKDLCRNTTWTFSLDARLKCQHQKQLQCKNILQRHDMNKDDIFGICDTKEYWAIPI